MTQQTRWSIGLFAFAVAVRLLFHQFTGFMADDAFITFRYAYNLAHSDGLVYNPGEHVLGTTTPLFAFLLGLPSAIGLDIPRAALVFGLFSSGMIAVLLYRLALILRFIHWALVPAVIYAVWPRSIVAESCGMEAPLFALFVLAAVYYYTRRLPIYALAMGTLASLTRPEGLAMLGLLVVIYLHQYRERWVQILITPLFLLGPWIVFATLYFGSPIPNSISGKLALYSRWGTMSIWDTLVFYMSWHNPVGWGVTLLSMTGGLWLWRKQNWGGVAAIWLVGMIGFYIFSGARVFFWYAAPLYPIMLLFAAAALPMVAGRVSKLENVGRKYAPVILILIGLLSIPGIVSAAKYYKSFQQSMDNCHREVASFLSTHVGDDDLVAAEDIGYMGFYSRKRILDRDGLVSPEAAPYNLSGDYGGLIRDYKPDWLVAAPDMPTTGFLSDLTFLTKYQEVQEFTGAGCRYKIFRRQ
jgi:hypothetical protein